MDNDISTAVKWLSGEASGSNRPSLLRAPAAACSGPLWPLAMARSKACPVAVRSSGVGWLIILWGGSHSRIVFWMRDGRQ